MVKDFNILWSNESVTIFLIYKMSLCLDALIGQIAPTTVFADPNMTAVSSPFVRTKPLHADLALFYGPGGSEYELSSGGGFKLGSMTASTWVVQKRTREINESEEKVSVSQFDNFDLEGSWVPTGNCYHSIGIV